MNDKHVYLRPSVVIEPLVNNWTAWSHLISPATAAMNIANRHLPIISSYLFKPEMHAEASRDPQKSDGPFMNLKTKRLNEIKALQMATFLRCHKPIRLAEAIRDLDRLLTSKKAGAGLKNIYEEMPAILKGYVELCYDRNSHAGFRVLESLLYDSEYYNEALQSIALWSSDNRPRPFFLNTPRLEEPEVIRLPMAFSHPGIDELAKMVSTPQPLSYIKQRLNIPPGSESLFGTLFTETPPIDHPEYIESRTRIRYFGDSCILVETGGVSILLDPVFGYDECLAGTVPFSFADIPKKIDYVLITQNDHEHITFEMLLFLRHKVNNFIVPRSKSGRLEDPDLKLMLDKTGFANVTGISGFETLRFGNAEITGLPFICEHDPLNTLTRNGYYVKIDERKLLFMNCSSIVEPALYRHVQKQIGDIDMLFLRPKCSSASAAWVYDPLLPGKQMKRHSNPSFFEGCGRVAEKPLVDAFHPKEVYMYDLLQQ